MCLYVTLHLYYSLYSILLIMEENIYQLVLLVHNLENLLSALVHNLEPQCQFQTDSKADGSVGDTFSIYMIIFCSHW